MVDGSAIAEEVINTVKSLDHGHLLAKDDSEEQGTTESEEVTSSSSESGYQELFTKEMFYNFEPLFLDSTKLRYGKHLHVVQLPGLRSSLMPYVADDEKKARGNKMF